MGSGSARLRGALCLAPFEKMPRFMQIRSDTSSQVTWRSWSTACPRYAPPTWCHPTMQLGRPWRNGSPVHFLPAPPKATFSSLAICLANCVWPRFGSGWCQPERGPNSVRRVAPSWGAVQRGYLALFDWRPLNKRSGFRGFEPAPSRRGVVDRGRWLGRNPANCREPEQGILRSVFGWAVLEPFWAMFAPLSQSAEQSGLGDLWSGQRWRSQILRCRCFPHPGHRR